MPEGLTLEQLQARGATPIQSTGGRTLAQLQNQGVRPQESEKAFGRTSEIFKRTLRGEPSFPANRETTRIRDNIIKAPFNIPSSAIGFAAPINPFNVQGGGAGAVESSPINIGGAFAKNIPGIVKQGSKLIKDEGIKGGAEFFAQGVKSTVDKILKAPGDAYINYLRKTGFLDNPNTKNLFNTTILKPLKALAIIGIEDPLLIPTLLQGGAAKIGRGADPIKTAAVPVKATAAVTGEALGKAGGKIKKSGVEAEEVAHKAFVTELVTPIKNKKVLESEVTRTKVTGIGPFKKKVVTPTKSETIIITQVGKIKGVKKGNTLQENFNVITKENVRLSENLKTDIAENDFAISKKESRARINAVTKILEGEALIVGDAAKTAEKILVKARQLIDEAPGTGSGLLQARKDFDAWILEQKPKAFAGDAAENAFTIAKREVRDTMTNLLEEKAVSVEVKASLKAQSNLFRALDNIKPKAAKEAVTVIGRISQKAGELLGVRNKAVQILATATGIGAFSAVQAFAPFVSAIGGSIFAVSLAGKLILKPAVRKALGTILEKAGHVLNPKDKKFIEKLLKDTEDISTQGGFVANPLGQLADSSKGKPTPKKLEKSQLQKESSINDNITKKVDKPEGETVFHGTSAKFDKIKGDKDGLVYVTSLKDEAKIFSTDPILSGEKGPPKSFRIYSKTGKSKKY